MRTGTLIDQLCGCISTKFPEVGLNTLQVFIVLLFPNLFICSSVCVCEVEVRKKRNDLSPFLSSVMLFMAQIASLSAIGALDMPAPITNLVTKSAHSFFPS
jgi:hypothetical protein